MIVVDDVVTMTVHDAVNILPVELVRAIGLDERPRVALMGVGQRLRMDRHRSEGPEGQAQAEQRRERSSRGRSQASHRAHPLSGSVSRHAKGATLSYPPGEDSMLS